MVTVRTGFPIDMVTGPLKLVVFSVERYSDAAGSDPNSTRKDYKKQRYIGFARLLTRLDHPSRRLESRCLDRIIQNLVRKIVWLHVQPSLVETGS